MVLRWVVATVVAVVDENIIIYPTQGRVPGAWKSTCDDREEQQSEMCNDVTTL
jgi:hypothetical protein